MRTVRQAGGVIVFVDAPVEVRYERMKARERDAEAVLTLEQFRANEEKEMYSGPNDADFNLRQIKAEADVVIENSVTLESFLAECYARLGLN
jgi:dephospho-CoA kinase